MGHHLAQHIKEFYPLYLPRNFNGHLKVWMEKIAKAQESQVIAIDGKTHL